MVIKNLRQDINDIDDQIALLLKHRMQISGQIISEKKKNSMPISDFKREQEIIDRVFGALRVYDRDSVEKIYFQIFKESKKGAQK